MIKLLFPTWYSWAKSKMYAYAYGAPLGWFTMLNVKLFVFIRTGKSMRKVGL